METAKAAKRPPARMQEFNREIEMTEDLRTYWCGRIIKILGKHYP
jgi:hypothetical protein